MPDLNGRGQAVGGIGGAIVHIDDFEVARPAGGACWFDDDWVIYQVCRAGQCTLEMFNANTGERIQVSGRGADQVAAGGGVWAAWLGGYGFYTSTGLSLPNAGHGRSRSVGPDGAVAFKDAYHSAGPWTVVERDGTEWRLTDGDASDVQLLGAGRALWRENGAVRTRNLPPVTTLPGPTHWPLGVVWQGALWVLYQSEALGGRLVLHPADRLDGYVLTEPLARTYRPDAVVLPDGRLRVAWAVGEAEAPGELRRAEVAPGQRTMRLTDLLGPPTDPPPPPDPEVPVSIPDYFHVVRAIDAAHPHLLQKNDHDSVREFYWRAAWALHQADARFGMLSKSEGETHQEIGSFNPPLLVAEDAVAYKDATPIVDIIAGANNAPHRASAAWQVDERRRESNKWVQPPPFVQAPQPDPDPDPEPDPDPPPAEDLGPLVRQQGLTLLRLERELQEARAEADAARLEAQATAAKCQALEKRLRAGLPVTGTIGRSLGHAHGFSGATKWVE